MAAGERGSIENLLQLCPHQTGLQFEKSVNDFLAPTAARAWRPFSPHIFSEQVGGPIDHIRLLREIRQTIDVTGTFTTLSIRSRYPMTPRAAAKQLMMQS